MEQLKPSEVLELKNYINRFNNYDYQYFKSINPELSLMFLLASDYYYCEGIANETFTTKNNDYLKEGTKFLDAAQSLIGTIPVVGTVMDCLKSFGLDFSAFTGIDRSSNAKQRMVEWNINQFKDYNILVDADKIKLGLELSFNGMKQKNNILNQKVIDARPKCSSPTPQCSKEHERYVLRTELHKKTQERLLEFTIWYLNGTKQGLIDFNSKVLSGGALWSNLGETVGGLYENENNSNNNTTSGTKTENKKSVGVLGLLGLLMLGK